MSRGRGRLRHHEEEEDHGRERWLVSYADFITLLMAFFVVMYAISSVNTGKFKVFSNSLETVLKSEPARPIPVDLGGGAPPTEGLLDGTRSVSPSIEPASGQPVAVPPQTVAPTAAPTVGTPKERLEAVAGSLGGQDNVRVRETRDWIELELGSEVLFATGSATLNPGAEGAVAKVAAVVADLGRPVRVEGYTDNVPLTGGPFGSNWGLSAARAATIAERLAAAKVPPTRIAATGYGEFRPVADNATAEGRRRNRRVVVAIAKRGNVALSVEASAAEQETVEPEDPEKPQVARTLQHVGELPGPAEITP